MNKMALSIDWVEFTIKDTKIEDHIRLLGLTKGDFVTLKGGLGYSQSIRHESGVVIYFDGREDMGTHIKFSGSALRNYEPDWFNIFLFVDYYKGSFTRIDLALDLYQMNFTIEHLYQKHKEGLLSMLWSSVSNMETTDRRGNLTGRTLYLGSRESNVFLRFYDKYLESKNADYKGVERLEIEYKKEAADVLGKKIFKRAGLSNLLTSTLKKYLKVKKEKKGENRSRWPPCPYYEEIISNAEQIKLTRPKEELTIEKAKENYWRLASGLAYTISEYDGNTDFIEACRNGAGYRLSQRHKDLLSKKEK